MITYLGRKVATNVARTASAVENRESRKKCRNDRKLKG